MPMRDDNARNKIQFLYLDNEFNSRALASGSCVSRRSGDEKKSIELIANGASAAGELRLAPSASASANWPF